MDYVDESQPAVASGSTCTAQTGDDPALTGEDPALLKLIRKIEACDAVEDAEERRQFVAKHAKSFGLSVAEVLSRLRVRGTLSAEEVNTHVHTRTHTRTHALMQCIHTHALMQCIHTRTHSCSAYTRGRTHAGVRLGRQRQGARHRALA
jgi:hypothetical protein